MTIHKRRIILLSSLTLLLLVIVLLSGLSGQFGISPTEIIASIFRKIGLNPTRVEDKFIDGVLWNVRFPRVLLGLLVGASLGVAGTIMQGLFRNSLAEPGIVGVSSGATVGALLATALSSGAMTTFFSPLVAFICGLGTVMLVYFFAQARGSEKMLTLILTGIAVNAFSAALIALILFIKGSISSVQLIFWELGSLTGATWEAVVAVFVTLFIGLIGALFISKKLDLLALGERQAYHLGINLNYLFILGLILVAVLAAGAVAFSGAIAFVGLIVPNLLRTIIGPQHKFLIIASALGGALLVTTCDLVARIVIPSTDIPVGIFTALIGGLTFFVLLRKFIPSSRY